MTRDPGVTVVLPTWHRPAGLRRALEGLSDQEPIDAPWEIVVVASGGDPNAHAVVDAMAGRLPAPTRVVAEARPGASRARNCGLAVSRAVVAFVDDDCVPDHRWLAAVTRPITDGRVAGVGGRVVPDPSVPVPRWLGAALLDFLARYDRGDAYVELRPDDYVLTANAAFDAELLSRVGGFDPLLGPNAGRPTVNDDVDLCRKVFAAGGTMAYTPDAVVVHDLPPARLSPAYLIRRMYAQGVSDWLLDRGTLAAARTRGADTAVGRMAHELSVILRQGPWHRSVLLHAAGSVSRAAGFIRQAAAGLPLDQAP